jgi:excisionase family DNA binding protein
MNRLYTIVEAAQILRVHKITLKRWIKKGNIKAFAINSRGDKRITEEELEEFLKGNHE